MWLSFWENRGYTQIFYYVGFWNPNPCAVQGLSVFYATSRSSLLDVSFLISIAGEMTPAMSSFSSGDFGYRLPGPYLPIEIWLLSHSPEVTYVHWYIPSLFFLGCLGVLGL